MRATRDTCPECGHPEAFHDSPREGSLTCDVPGCVCAITADSWRRRIEGAEGAPVIVADASDPDMPFDPVPFGASSLRCQRCGVIASPEKVEGDTCGRQEGPLSLVRCLGWITTGGL